MALAAFILGLFAAWKVVSFAFPGPPSTLVEIRQDGVCVADWTGGHLRTQDWSNAWTGIEATCRTVVLHYESGTRLELPPAWLPHRIYLDATLDYLYVADHINKRIQVFHKASTLKGTCGPDRTLSDPEMDQPVSMRVTFAGELIVASQAANSSGEYARKESR